MEGYTHGGACLRREHPRKRSTIQKNINLEGVNIQRGNLGERYIRSGHTHGGDMHMKENTQGTDIHTEGTYTQIRHKNQGTNTIDYARKGREYERTIQRNIYLKGKCI